MTQPSDLVAHYSSLLFQSRIYARILIAAVLAAWLQLARTAVVAMLQESSRGANSGVWAFLGVGEVDGQPYNPTFVSCI